MCDMQRLSSACAYAQSVQILCLSHEYSMTVKLLTEQHLEFLSINGGRTDSSESTHVKVPHCWKSHAAAQIIENGPEHVIITYQVMDVTRCLGAYSATVLPAKSDSNVMFCLQSYQGLRIDKSLVYYSYLQDRINTQVICRFGLAQVECTSKFCKQKITPLSLLAGTTVNAILNLMQTKHYIEHIDAMSKRKTHDALKYGLSNAR